jgi:class 3 adenylate cyclase
LILNITGLFFYKEILVFNVTFALATILPMMIFKVDAWSVKSLLILQTTAFNISDAYFSFSKEVNNTINMVAIEKKSLALSQFVNRLLPKHIQETINKPGVKQSTFYKDVTILYADIVGFTDFSNQNSPRQVVAMLSSLFTDFDKECNRLHLFKIYTIGDCYVLMSFLDNNDRRSPGEEANAVTQMAISMIKIINKVREELGIGLNMRIRIHTGDVYGGVIGTDLVRFDLYGSDVVIANKMESKGTPGKINVSDKTKKILETLETTNYAFEENTVVKLDSLGRSVPCFFINWDINLS